MASGDGSRFKLLGLAELNDLPEPSWLIEGILAANAVVVLYGASAIGKTFVALSMALSVAAGHPWCGKPTKSGSVLYVAAEGVFGLKLRVQAYQGRHRIDAKDIRYLGEGFDLRQAADIKQLVAILEAADFRPNLVVLDTLARLIPGADENSAQDIGKAIWGIDELKHKFSATVLVVHHTGKDGGSERGSSALRCAVETMIKCSAKPSDPHIVFLDCDKMKDAKEFRLQLSTSRWCRLVQQLRRSRSQVGAMCHLGPVLFMRTTAAQSMKRTILQILQTQFPAGATNTDLRDAFRQATGMEKSTFDRAFRALKATRSIRQVGTKYYANLKGEGVKCQEVSKECHDTSHDGVMSSPPLGDDTDAVAIGQK
jgi:hypothetical protein